MDLLLSCQYDSEECHESDDNESDKQPSNTTTTTTTTTANANQTKTNNQLRIQVNPTGTSNSLFHAKKQKTTHAKTITINPFLRSVPHIRGNWCGHVYLEIHPYENNATQLLHAAARRKYKWFHQFLIQNHHKKNIPPPFMTSHIPSTDMECNKNATTEPTAATTKGLHISLSRPFYLQQQSIQPFIQNLTKRFIFQPFFKCTLSTSTVYHPSHPHDILVNDDQTRSFLTISSSHHHPHHLQQQQAFQHLVSHVNSVMKLYNQPCFYEDPKIHVSIASIKGDLRQDLPPVCDKHDTHLNHSSDLELHHPPYPRKASQDDHEEDDLNEVKDDHEDESDLDIPDEITLEFHHVYCTFGTTKKYCIDLMN